MPNYIKIFAYVIEPINDLDDIFTLFVFNLTF